MTFGTLTMLGQDTAPTLAVVPVLVGPLVPILVSVLVGAGGLVLALFKWSTLKKAAKFAWRQKVAVLVAGGVGAGAVMGIRAALVTPNGRVLQEEASATAWPMARGGPMRRGTAGEGPSPAEGGRQWALAADAKTFYCSPAVVGNRVYATSADKGVFNDSGAIWCLDADTGGVVWRCQPEGFRATFSSPAVSGRYLVSGEGLHFTRDARIVCLDLARGGAVAWEFRTASHVESSPCIYQGRVYVGAGDDGYWCLDLEPGPDGKPRVVWHAPGERYPDAEASPAAADGRVYVGLGMGGRAVVCLDARTGAEVWRTETPYPVFAASTLARGRVLVGMGNGNYIQTAEEVRADEVAKLRAAGKSEAEIAAAQRALGPAGEVWCLDAATGQVAWRFRTERTVLGAVATDGERIYAGARDGNLYCIDFDGKELGRWNARSPILTSPALTRTHVYVVTSGGTLFAVDRETLRPVWEAPLGTEGPFLSSPTVARGRVYVGTQADGLLCLGRPAGTSEHAAWAGFLGGPGRGGAVDSDPLPAQGALAWRYPAGAEGAPAAPIAVRGPAACVEGAILVPVADGPRRGLACLEHDASAGQTPRERWFYETPLGVTASPAADNEVVLVADGARGDAGRHLRCLDLATGKERWRMPLATDARGEVLLGPGCVFIENAAGTLACLDLEGTVLWRRAVGPMSGSAAWEGAIAVAAVASPPALVALDRPTGAVLWRVALDSPPATGPVVRDAVVYLGTAAGIEARGVIDGSVAWRAATGGAAGAIALGRESLVYVNTAGELVRIDPKTGRPCVRLPGALAAVPPVLVQNGVLYATTAGLVLWDGSAAEAATWLDTSALGAITSPVVTAKGRAYFATDRGGFLAAGARRD